jgi:hypothetical protein
MKIIYYCHQKGKHATSLLLNLSGATSLFLGMRNTVRETLQLRAIKYSLLKLWYCSIQNTIYREVKFGDGKEINSKYAVYLYTSIAVVI